MDFIKECEEWLNPLGYTIHFKSGDNKMVSFINIDEPHTPSIKCSIDKNDKKQVEVSGGNLKYFLTITSTPFQFKHKDIEKYLSIISHYIRICELNPPF